MIKARVKMVKMPVGPFRAAVCQPAWRRGNMTFWHWVAHLFGRNTGRVYSWWDTDTGKRRLMIGFKCDGCDTISGVHQVRVNDRPAETEER